MNFPVRSLLTAIGLFATACASKPQTPFGTPSQAEWTLARSRLSSPPRRPASASLCRDRQGGSAGAAQQASD